jgi:gas vesicle protein
MKSTKVFLGVLYGVIVGSIAGVLFAPRKGSDSRKKVSKHSNKYAESIKNKFSDFIDNVTEKMESEQEKLTEHDSSDKSSKKMHAAGY